MKKTILIIALLFLTTSLSAIERIKSLKQLDEHKISFLVFEKNGCPWCGKYKSELEHYEAGYESRIKFFKAKKGTEITKKILKKFNKGRLIIYPMTYVIKDNKIIHEIYGYQDAEYLEELFKELLK